MKKLSLSFFLLSAFLFSLCAESRSHENAKPDINAAAVENTSIEIPNTINFTGGKACAKDDPYLKKHLESITLKERTQNILEGIKDEATKARIENLLHETNRALKFFKIDEKAEGIFEGSTFGFSNYVLISTLTLLLIYGLGAILIVKILLFIALKISKLNKLHALSEILQTLNSPISKLVYANAFYVSFWRLALFTNYASLYDNFFTAVFTILWTWIIIRIFDVAAAKTERYAITHAGVREVFSLFKRFLRWMIIIIAALVLADRLGFDVRAFMFSLGIGGAALAFASKDTIANFFGSISLIIDAPFRIGDRIKVSGKLDGTVESIGIRSTRIRNLDNTTSILPNSYLANEYIVNISEWKKRKAESVIGLVYSTTPTQMRAILADIKRLLVAEQAIADDGISVIFKEFAASSLNIYIAYFTKSTDTAVYNETVERINLALMDIVAKNGTDMAFPTQTVYSYNMPEKNK